MSLMKKICGVVLVAGWVVASGAAVSQDDSAAIQERLAPVGSLCMSGDECAAAPAAPASAGPKTGDEVYAGFCTTCHGAGLMGAPKSGSSADWAPRIAKGLDTLYNHALNGFNAMPPKGMCAACSEDEIKAAVDYMVDKAK